MMDEFYSGNSCEPMTAPNVKTLELKDMIAVLNAKLCAINLCLGAIIRKLFCIRFEENILERCHCVLILESAHGALFRLLWRSPVQHSGTTGLNCLLVQGLQLRNDGASAWTPLLALLAVPPPSSYAVSAVLPSVFRCFAPL